MRWGSGDERRCASPAGDHRAPRSRGGARGPMTTPVWTERPSVGSSSGPVPMGCPPHPPLARRPQRPRLLPGPGPDRGHAPEPGDGGRDPVGRGAVPRGGEGGDRAGPGRGPVLAELELRLVGSWWRRAKRQRTRCGHDRRPVVLTARGRRILDRGNEIVEAIEVRLVRDCPVIGNPRAAGGGLCPRSPRALRGRRSHRRSRSWGQLAGGAAASGRLCVPPVASVGTATHPGPVPREGGPGGALARRRALRQRAAVRCHPRP